MTPPPSPGSAGVLLASTVLVLLLGVLWSPRAALWVLAAGAFSLAALRVLRPRRSPVRVRRRGVDATLLLAGAVTLAYLAATAPLS